MTQILNTLIQLRRDNDYNYKSTFRPLKGEVCFVDTVDQGLRCKVGDGIRSWNNLAWADALSRGYYKDGSFYSDSNFQTIVKPTVNSLYIDAATDTIYLYNGKNYKSITGNFVSASEETPGVLKLYSTTGSHVDGTMTQKAITENLYSVSINEEELTLIKGGAVNG